MLKRLSNMMFTFVTITLGCQGPVLVAAILGNIELFTWGGGQEYVVYGSFIVALAYPPLGRLFLEYGTAMGTPEHVDPGEVPFARFASALK